MSKQTVPLQIELPVDLVELLANHGDELLAALEAAIVEARRVADSGLIQERRERIERRSEARREILLKVGRYAHRVYRRLSIEDIGVSDRNSVAVSLVARELEQPPALVKIALSRHRKELRNRIRSRRKLSALRRMLKGHSNAEIASALGIHPNTVSGLLKACRELALSKSISLSELERGLTAERFEDIRKAMVQADNVVDWQKIRQLRGRGL
tara:strand:+ start:101 stop:739 length:639 start_codon:yes stop_codon:yes gene_type:complete